jgi:uncharacterized membrane protein
MLTSWSCLRSGIDAFVRGFPLLMGAWLVILAGQQLIDLAIPDLYAWVELPAAVVVLAPLYAGQYLLAYKVVRGESVSFRELFRGFGHWGTIVAVSVLVSIIVFLGSFLLVVPAIVWSIMFAFAPIAILDPRNPGEPSTRLGVFDAMKRSKDLTSGYKGTLFGVGLIVALPTIAIATLATVKLYVPEFPLPYWILELLSLLSGALFLGPVLSTSYMVAYSAITDLERASQP